MPGAAIFTIHSKWLSSIKGNSIVLFSLDETKKEKKKKKRKKKRKRKRTKKRKKKGGGHGPIF